MLVNVELLLLMTPVLPLICCCSPGQSTAIEMLPSVVAKAITITMLSSTTGGSESGREADGE